MAAALEPGIRGPYRENPRKAEAIARARTSETYASIAADVGVSLATVSMWASAAGIRRQAAPVRARRPGKPGQTRLVTFAGRPVVDGMVIRVTDTLHWFVLSVREVKGWHRARVLCGRRCPPGIAPELLAWYREGLAELAP